MSQRAECGWELFVEHRTAIQSYVRSLVPSKADAADVLQELGLVAARSKISFADDTQFIQWCCGVARHMVAHRRRSHVRRERLRAEITEHVTTSLTRDDTNPESRVARMQQLRRELSSIPAAQIEMLVARYVLGATAAEIAAKSQHSPAAIRMILSRIRAGRRARS